MFSCYGFTGVFIARTCFPDEQGGKLTSSFAQWHYKPEVGIKPRTSGSRVLKGGRVEIWVPARYGLKK